MEACCFDLNSFLVTVSSVLVTALIGWQIFNVIAFEKRIDEVAKELEDKLTKHIDLRADEAKYQATSTALYNIAEAAFATKDYANALSCYVKSLWNLYNENEEAEDIDLVFDKIDNVLNELQRQSKTINLPDDVIDRYLDGLDPIKNRKKDRIVNFYINLKNHS